MNDTNARVGVATGSVAGRVHRRMGKPNQDAVAWRAGEAATVLVVCDGCGSGSRSEVGAELTARWWARALVERVEAGARVDDELFAAAGDEVLERLAALCATLAGGDEAARLAVVSSHLLATSLCAVVTAEQVAVHAIGDGVVGLGRELHVLEPGADNCPAYLAAGLVGARPRGETWLADAGVGSVLVATDGAVPVLVATDGAVPVIGAPGRGLDAGEGVDVLFRNPAALGRKLALLAEDATTIDWDAGRVDRTPAWLDDDATIAIARWRARS